MAFYSFSTYTTKYGKQREISSPGYFLDIFENLSFQEIFQCRFADPVSSADFPCFKSPAWIAATTSSSETRSTPLLHEVS